jgi:hypothetical protein
MKPYDIPLRALIAKDVDGLLMAGRCISGDFIAHSSYRVTGNAVAMGEAAGVTAALAALSKRHASRGHLDRERGQAEGDGPARVHSPPGGAWSATVRKPRASVASLAESAKKRVVRRSSLLLSAKWPPRTTGTRRSG